MKNLHMESPKIQLGKENPTADTSTTITINNKSATAKFIYIAISSCHFTIFTQRKNHQTVSNGSRYND